MSHGSALLHCDDRQTNSRQRQRNMNASGLDSYWGICWINVRCMGLSHWPTKRRDSKAVAKLNWRRGKLSSWMEPRDYPRLRVTKLNRYQLLYFNNILHHKKSKCKLQTVNLSAKSSRINGSCGCSSVNYRLMCPMAPKLVERGALTFIVCKQRAINNEAVGDWGVWEECFGLFKGWTKIIVRKLIL